MAAVRAERERKNDGLAEGKDDELSRSLATKQQAAHAIARQQRASSPRAAAQGQINERTLTVYTGII